MKNRKTDTSHNKRISNPMHSLMIICCLLIIPLFSFFSCSNKPATPPVKVAQKKSVTNTGIQTALPQPAIVDEEEPKQEGYIYQRRDRRDPFIPLIVLKKSVQKGKGVKPGTLASYDLNEFSLAAIARKGWKYYALLTTPDNRSFTVYKGTRVGLNKGKVKNISRDKIVLVEYSRDFRGEIKPRQIILEFHKGEVE